MYIYYYSLHERQEFREVIDLQNFDFESGNLVFISKNMSPTSGLSKTACKYK